MKKITVTILGESYNLISDDPEPIVHDAARSVDISLRDIRERMRGAQVQGETTAILTALRIALSDHVHRHDVARRAERLVTLIDEVSIAS